MYLAFSVASTMADECKIFGETIRPLSNHDKEWLGGLTRLQNAVDLVGNKLRKIVGETTIKTNQIKYLQNI